MVLIVVLILSSFLLPLSKGLISFRKKIEQVSVADQDISQLGDYWSEHLSRLNQITVELLRLEMLCTIPSTQPAAKSAAVVLETEAKKVKNLLEASFLSQKGRMKRSSFYNKNSGPCLNASSFAMKPAQNILIEFEKLHLGEEFAGLRVYEDHFKKIFWSFYLSRRIYPCSWKSGLQPC